jgi:succinate-acetate transporter protein
MAEIDNINRQADLDYTLHKIQSNVFHVKCKNQLSDSIVDFFAMAIGFFMFGCINAEMLYSDDTKYLFYGNIIIAGIVQIILGVYDWYKGKSISILTNFSFGLLFITWFLKYYLIENENIAKDKKYEGAIYIIWLLLVLIIIFGVKNKGLIYSLDYLAVAVGFLFLIISKYSDIDWIKKVHGYAFIVSGGLFWITGLLRFINNAFLNNNLGIVRE